MRPVLRDYNIPSYPDKEYQEHKWNYCKKLLTENMGQASEDNELEIVYDYNGGKVICGKVMGGKAAYTGGNIDIHFMR